MTPPIGPLLAGRRVLLAYGLLGEGLVRLGLDYMAGQLRWLQAMGAEARVVPLPTTAAIAGNAAQLAGAVLAEPGRCVILAHSKGGLEALSALLDPAVAERCDGLLALQSPFGGSLLADAILARPWLHHGLRGLVRAGGLGGGAGLADLATAERQRWMAQHAPAVQALTARLPVLCLASQLTPETAIGPDRRYLPLVRWMQRQGAGPNDGLVSVASALLPGARHQVLAAGHRGLVSPGRGRDPVGVLQAALLALLSPAAAPQALPPQAPAPQAPPPP